MIHTDRIYHWIRSVYRDSPQLPLMSIAKENVFIADYPPAPTPDDTFAYLDTSLPAVLITSGDTAHELASIDEQSQLQTYSIKIKFMKQVGPGEEYLNQMSENLNQLMDILWAERNLDKMDLQSEAAPLLMEFTGDWKDIDRDESSMMLDATGRFITVGYFNIKITINQTL